MPTATDLDALVEKYAAMIPDLNLEADDQEEYSTMLLMLQNTIETGEPNERIMDHCLAYLRQFEASTNR